MKKGTKKKRQKRKREETESKRAAVGKDVVVRSL